MYLLTSSYGGGTMRSRITRDYASGRNIMITTLLMVSLLISNNSEASNPSGTMMNPTTIQCLLAEQLKDPVIRADYDAIIADSEETGINRTVLLDPISMECITCHDGITAKAVNHRISDGNTHRVKSIETIKGAHPVGMDYDKFGWNKEYVPSEILTKDIILINGKVGCVSCHNLLGNNDKYLAVDNSTSKLCFSCHYK
jgi:predicted CXXCH cytochrome family protein